eukprot:CAMPEP_0206018882 /NCGR_PEP_ID=MMETSP1464-20131121/28054_1 /ASSEMBLY_ACC=CAM_ASM_001124 /TAXON_ID=119497 /ORGANISM="Exanthemachrysis gayraliae, Strain RCC1523" /LENGTH=297 /DNA_ID=CAMNT_0053392771 /DNA_START=97 /DNA_END=986 /DNA_ORIENTATION=+
MHDAAWPLQASHSPQGPSELRPPLARGVARVLAHLPPLAAHGLLLAHHPVPVLDGAPPLAARAGATRARVLAPHERHGAALALRALPFCDAPVVPKAPGHAESRVRGPREQHQKVFLGAGGVGIVNNKPSAKPGAHRRGRDELELGGVLRVELQGRASPAAQAPVQGLEEAQEPLPRALVRALRVAQPLHCRHRDRSVEYAVPEREAVAHVAAQEAAAGAALHGGLEHGPGDVRAHPRVARLLEHLAAEAGAAAYVEQKARCALGQAEHLQGALRHGALHLDHARVVQVLGRLILAV